MDSGRLRERINDYHKALLQLEKAVLHPNDEFIRDSVIQRFEFTDLAEKMLRLHLDDCAGEKHDKVEEGGGIDADTR